MKMNMKKIISWGMMLAAAFTLTNCAKEIEDPNQQAEKQGYPFEIVASTVDTKTVNDGMATKWDDNDAINLFHAVAGKTDYVTNDEFTIADVETGRFTGTLTEALEAGKSYDWYALYPYNSYIATPGEREVGYVYIGHSKGLNQTGYDNMESLKETICPLYGVAKEVASSETPSITMNHLTSVVAIKVTNTTEELLTIETASLTAEDDIVGSYYIDITQSPVVYTASGEDYVKNTAVVNVSDGTALDKGESATLYLAIKPFTAKAGTSLTLSVNGYAKEPKVLTSDVTFHAGKIKTLTFAYDKVEEPEQPSAWVLTELANIKTGDQVVIVSTKDGNSYAMSNDKGTSSAPQAVKVTYSDNMLSQAPDKNLVWSFEVTNNKYSFYKDSDTWLYCTNTNNGVRVGTNEAKTFVLDAASGYLKHEGTSRFLGVYNSQDWRCYTNTTGNTVDQTFQFFVKTIGVETPEVPMTPELAVDPATVNVAAAGGDAEFSYIVTNPTDGVSVSASTEATWISGFVYSTANKVTFTVAENTETEAREAVVTLSYIGAESKTVTVKQDAKVPEGMKVDVLTRATTGVEGTTYAEWSGKTVATSSAVYAGQSAGGNDAIQLRSNNNNSGIVTTISGGYVKKVVVTWNSNTAADRTLNVYGKNSAYSAATDLYDSNTQGTLLGTIINGTSTELEVTGNYQYIGLRSASGAMYLDEIQITWSPEASDAPVVPELAVNPATVEVAAAGGNAEFGYTVTNPTEGVSVSASTVANWISDFVYSTANKVSFTVAENTATEAREAVVTLSYTGAESKTVTIKQAAAESSEPETPGAEGTHYVKVTSEPTDWSGDYLIVCEYGAVAFDGSLTTLDAVNNTVSVAIEDGKIKATDAMKSSQFTIDASGIVKSASGYYIGQTSNVNGLKSSQSTKYTNTISVNNDGTVNIVSGGAYLRYNSTSGQYRFRYYKSSSYTGQKAIQLYKLN